MTWLFASGHAIDIVLAFMAVEGVWLIARRQSPQAVFLMLAPGALMLVALRFALTGVDWEWIALAVTASLPLHLADARRRGFL